MCDPVLHALRRLRRLSRRWNQLNFKPSRKNRPSYGSMLVWCGDFREYGRVHRAINRCADRLDSETRLSPSRWTASYFAVTWARDLAGPLYCQKGGFTWPGRCRQGPREAMPMFPAWEPEKENVRWR